jgi:hypothetical protein
MFGGSGRISATPKVMTELIHGLDIHWILTERFIVS